MSFWPQKLPIAIAHRGGAAAYAKQKHKVENTIEAFEAAVKLGYNYLELDVIKTADDKVIIIHVAKNWFESIFKKKDAPSYPTLQKLTYDEITLLLDRKIPTLEAVLKKFPKVKLFVEIKSDTVIRPAVELLKQSKALDRIAFVSFYPHRLTQLYKLTDGKVPLGLNISRAPMHFLQQRRFLNDSSWRQSVKLFSVSCPWPLATKSYTDKLHSWNLKLFVFGANGKRSIRWSINSGVDGIMSDNIHLLKKMLD